MPRLLNPEELWRDIFDGDYQVSSFGKIRRNKFGPGSSIGKVLKFDHDKDGYATCTPSVNGKKVKVRVATLVADAFIGKRPVGKVINHIDSVRTNNHWQNLEYITQKENIAQCMARGVHKSQNQYGVMNSYWKGSKNAKASQSSPR